MTQEIVIQLRITVPDGTAYRVINVPEPDSVLTEPLPTEPVAADWSQPTGEAPSARRGIAVQPGQVWAVGQVHAKDHKPLRANSRGLFCPTPIGQGPDGKALFCPFRP